MSGERLSCRGFSLLEMLIVISLLAIVSAIAYPRLYTLHGRRSVAKAADKFISHYGLARSAAMQFGRTSRLYLDATSGRVWIAVDTSLAGSGDTMIVEQPYDLSDLGVEMTTTRSLFCFDSRGFPGRAAGCANTPATITFDRGAISRTLEVTSGGRIRQ